MFICSKKITLSFGVECLFENESKKIYDNNYSLFKCCIFFNSKLWLSLSIEWLYFCEPLFIFEVCQLYKDERQSQNSMWIFLFYLTSDIINSFTILVFFFLQSLNRLRDFCKELFCLVNRRIINDIISVYFVDPLKQFRLPFRYAPVISRASIISNKQAYLYFFMWIFICSCLLSLSFNYYWKNILESIYLCVWG